MNKWTTFAIALTGAIVFVAVLRAIPDPADWGGPATFQASAKSEAAPAGRPAEKAAAPAEAPAPTPAVEPIAAEKVAMVGSSGTDYLRAVWNPIHFKPAIDQATNDDCLGCHAEILERRPKSASLVGLPTGDATAWYQTVATYAGDQDTFHRRHLTSDYARAVMDLACTFCHQGNDPREEVPGNGTQPDGQFTLRKMVDPEKTCLLCHGAFPYQNMEGLAGPWTEARADLENEDTRNGCLVCHAETFRTVRHQVSYLKPEAIEDLARESSDVCHGCHGGRQWYRISYPYPRHPWPDMPAETPEWAKDRPTESDRRYQLSAK